jgi:succinyl-CoA synthetase beta subunit
MTNLAKCFIAEDCSIAEINPLILTKDEQVLALDAKVNFDGNAGFRHEAYWDSVRDLSEEAATETEAKEAGLSYIQLDGNIGCLVNGAGLAMSTMDIIKHFGGEPANFLDVGGGASQESVTKAFKIILQSPSVKGIFVNIFGGIMKCDVIANGVVAAARSSASRCRSWCASRAPTWSSGKEILNNSGLQIVAGRHHGGGRKEDRRAAKGV